MTSNSKAQDEREVHYEKEEEVIVRRHHVIYHGIGDDAGDGVRTG